MKKKSLKTVVHYKSLLIYARALGWFSAGVILGLFFLISFTIILFQKIYMDRVFPGVLIDGVNFGGKTQLYVENYFTQKNKDVEKNTFTFSASSDYATASANALQAGYNSHLLAKQAMSIGRSSDFFSNVSLILRAYANGITLPASYMFSQNALVTTLDSMKKDLYIAPVDAQFTTSNGRVTTFKPSSDGQDIDIENAAKSVSMMIPYLFGHKKQHDILIPVSIKILHPNITTDTVNNLGIKELIGSGTSLFQHSIPSRVYNVELAASRLNGIIVSPNEEFSFDKALGDVSSYTGYQQAYIISGGHTILGDGGGVCQVSTTMFRAILHAGLPITERHAHDYRVGYYEEDGPPGIDATVYVPSVDLKFKNDTGHSILIQTVVDPSELRLTFNFYGTNDGRQVSLTTPVVSDEIPAPSPLYQNDPTLPKGVTKQTDFSANGAKVTFDRTVLKNGNVTIQETYVSNYRPWQAVFLVGTQ